MFHRRSQVDGGDAGCSEDHVVDAVGAGGPDGDGAPAEGSGRLEDPVAEAEPPIEVDAAQLVVGSVLEVVYGFPVGPRAGPVALDGGEQADAFVGPFGVVDLAPAVEPLRGLAQVGHGRSGERLGLERTVEALV